MSVAVSVADFKQLKYSNSGASVSKLDSMIDLSTSGNLLRACFMN